MPLNLRVREKTSSEPFKNRAHPKTMLPRSCRENTSCGRADVLDDTLFKIVSHAVNLFYVYEDFERHTVRGDKTVNGFTLK